MDLLDRYIAAIRQNLPVSRAEDITNELREELLDRIEARESELGRTLEPAELSAIIKAFGPPLVVAGRYREHRYLIGPDAYPFYLHGLRVTFVIVLAIFFLSAVLPALLSPANALEAFLRSLGNAWLALLVMFAVMTLLFAVGERFGMTKAQAKMWNPAHLPLHHERKKGKWEAPIQVGICVMLLLLWTGTIPLPIPVGHDGRGVHLTPGPVWTEHYWLVLGLGIASLVYSLMCWLRPRWTAERLILSIVLHGGWIWAAVLIRASGPWFTATSAVEFAEQATRTQAGVNATISLALPIMIMVWFIGLLVKLHQLYRHLFVGR